ncbi:hypothetical protein COLO4_10362 [Corchorus olitorius]|uniref:Uncharacterized protein n=1 Tax=Corchorus olitorius TaxID=93759 RepID=A0A1R3K8Y7_9ROSI|nr:hypothetical protein COLO4_10362 [Corchorus olitorius]
MCRYKDIDTFKLQIEMLHTADNIDICTFNPRRFCLQSIEGTRSDGTNSTWLKIHEDGA